MKQPVRMFTDGSCLRNGQENPVGGWACILRWKDTQSEFSGGPVSNATNNRMELTAVLQGLRLLSKPCNVEIFTDSRYVCDRLGQLQKLRENGWRSKGASVKNQDLLEEVSNVCLKGNHSITLQHITGHQGHPENERCDRLARAQAAR